MGEGLMSGDYTARTSVRSGPVAPNVQPIDIGLDQIADDWRRRAEAARAIEAETAGIKATAEGRLAAAKAFDELKKSATGTADDMAETIQEKWDEWVKPALDGVSGDARTFAERRLIAMRGDMVLDAYDFQEKKAKAATLRTLGDTLQVAANGIRTNPDTFKASMGDLEAMLASADLDEETKAALQEQQGGLYASMYVRGLADRDPYAAKRELNSGALDHLLEPGTKDGLLNAVDGDIKRREAEARQAQKEAEQAARIERGLRSLGLKDEIDSDIQSIIDTGVASDLDLNEVRAVEGEDGLAKLLTARERAFTLHDAVTGYEGLTRDQIMEKVDALKPKEGSDSYAQDKAIYEAALQASSAVIEERESDPAAVMQRVKPVREAGMRAESAEGDAAPKAMADYLNAMDAAYSDAYVKPSSRRYLTNQQAKAIVGSLSEGIGDPGQRLRDTLAGLRGTYGKRFPSVLNQLIDAGLPAEARGFLAIEDDPTMATRFTRGLTVAKDQEALMTPDAKSKVTKAINTNLTPFFTAASRAPGGARIAQDAVAIAKALTYANIADGKTPDAAARDAAQSFLSRYSIDGGLMVPASTQLDAGDVAETLDGYLRSLTADKVLGYEPMNYETAAEAQEAMRDSLFAEGGHRWALYGQEEGVQLLDANGLPVKMAGGEPIKLSWSMIRLLQVPE